MAAECASISRPPGLLYLCMKHVTDRYNMYYSYAPTKLNEQIHVAAVHQAVFAPLLGLLWMLFFSILRLGRYPARPSIPPLPVPHGSVTPQQQLWRSRKSLGRARCYSWNRAKPSAFSRP